MILKVIKDFPNYKISSTGKVFNSKGKEMSLFKNKDGYYQVHLHSKLCGRKLKRVNRLVAEAFLPNPDNLPVVDHIDGSRDNNNVENLEWVTVLENKRRSLELFPERNKPRASISEEDVHKVCQLIQDGLRNCDIVKSLPNISLDIIKHIRNKASWQNISSNYNLQGSNKGVSSNTVKWVCYRIKEGLSNSQILKMSSCSLLKIHTIKRIRAKSIYKDITEVILK